MTIICGFKLNASSQMVSTLVSANILSLSFGRFKRWARSQPERNLRGYAGQTGAKIETLNSIDIAELPELSQWP